jgi:hypothetical protein
MRRRGRHRAPSLMLEGGAPAEVLAVPGVAGAGDLAVSPDGNQLAFAYQEGSPVPLDKLAAAPASGGAPHFVSQMPIGAAGLCWAPSAEGRHPGAAPRCCGPRQITHFPAGLIFDSAWSRDGKQLLLAKGNQSSDVVLISNFR